jgi:hypothetical protein
MELSDLAISEIKPLLSLIHKQWEIRRLRLDPKGTQRQAFNYLHFSPPREIGKAKVECQWEKDKRMDSDG